MSAPADLDALLDALPPPLEVPGARQRIREANAAAGRRTAVLDDDPTGSQTVHDVSVLTSPDPTGYPAALAEPGSTCFVLTNTRSLPQDAAVALTGTAAGDLHALGRRLGAPVEIVSRSDSTLRGHVVAEVLALDAASRAATGRGYDGVLLVPAFFEAGRSTVWDVHLARVDGRYVPVGRTEFARDATFGYSSSDLRHFVAERSGGRIAPQEVRSVGLDDIRGGGPERVAQILDDVRGGRFVVVNATCYADLEVVVLGLLQVQAAGRAFLHRTGPSFVRALAGLEPHAPLTAADLRATTPPGDTTCGHGLVVVGSHVGLTSTQVEALRARGGLVEVELDVPALLDPARTGGHVTAATARTRAALAGADVLLLTSRALVRGGDGGTSLDIARTVSAAVTDVVRGALPARPAWVVAKGGITSHDVAVRGLGVRRATVLGQVLPGMVSVLRPLQAPAEVLGRPYVVFAGNVGTAGTLADVVDLLRTAHGTGG